MPYIEEKEKDRVLTTGPETDGELNFKITTVVNNFLPPKPTYKDYNAAIGVLECAKLELYRRRVADYEDAARLKNGDVY